MVKVENVSVRYLTGNFNDIGLKEWTIQKFKKEQKVKNIWAVKNVSFSLDSGDFLGIIGTNGAGKSTLLKSVTGILKPQEGKISTSGKLVALLELGTGFDGDLDLPENIRMRGALLGYTKDFIEEKIDSILEFAELTEFRWYKYKQLSSGMRSRLAFSICCMVEPDILILDEVLSVGDGAFRQKSKNKMMEIIKSGVSTLFVGHNSDIMKQLCTKVIWLEKGETVAYSENRSDSLQLLSKYDRYLKAKALNPSLKPDISSIPPAEKKKPASSKPDEIKNLNDTIKKIRQKEKYHIYYMKLMKILITEPQKQHNVVDFFMNKKISRIAVYSDSIFMETFVEILKPHGISVDYVVSGGTECSYCSNLYPKSLDKYPETQIILIGDLLNEEAVKNKLKNITNIPYVTVEEIIGLNNDR